MTGNAGGRGRGRRGNNNGNGNRGAARGSGGGSAYGGTNKSSKGVGIEALGKHIFDIGNKTSADQVRTSWEKLVLHAGTIYSSDISSELSNKIKVVLPKPVHSDHIQERHQGYDATTVANRQRMQVAHKARLA